MSNEPPSAQSPRKASRAFAPSRLTVDRSKALVFLDTNVLLAPYRTSATALEEIRRIYGKLRAEGRLIVPAQVAREFAKNRLALLARLYKQVRDSRTLGINGKYEAPAILHGLPAHREAEDALTKVRTAIDAYRQAVDLLVTTIGGWQRSDPVLDAYEKLLDDPTIRDVSKAPAEIEALRKARFDASVPPGFRDKSKEDGGVGDLVIWLTILDVAKAMGRDVIFVTEETKSDWYHREDGEPIFVRHELLSEFEETVTGRTIELMTLSSFLKEFGAPPAVVEELRERETRLSLRHEEDLAELKEALEALGHLKISTHSSIPNLVIEAPEGLIGLEVCHPSRFSDAFLQMVVRKVLAAAEGKPFVEVAVVYVLHSGVRATDFLIRLSSGRHDKPGVSHIVIYRSSKGMRVMLNTSRVTTLLVGLPEAKTRWEE